MARVVKNDKGFKVIALSHEEAKKAKIGFWYIDEEDKDKYGIICTHCNNLIDDEIYYISVLNDTMCKKCYEHWYKRATRYSDDIHVENRNFEYYKIKLDIHEDSNS